MRGRSGSFNLAVLLAACGLLTADGVDDAADGSSSRSNDPYCSPPLSVVLENGTDDATRENGTDDAILENSYVHDGIVYPAKFRWTAGNVTYGCICKMRSCLRKCCGYDEVLSTNSKSGATCQKMPQNDTENGMPELRLAVNLMSKEIKHIDNLGQHFHLIQDNVCPSGSKKYSLNPNDHEEAIILQANGSFSDLDGEIVPFWKFCIDWKVTVEQIGILVCWTDADEGLNIAINTIMDGIHHLGIMISIPFLVATFLVYAITPELKNLYGQTLMCYVFCLIIAYISLLLVNYIYVSSIRMLCFAIAFIIHFSFLASFFWLNVMCFDIWWTFGGFRSLQGSMKQRERKKFVMYSIYAWGSASILTIVCVIMDFVPSVPKELIRPEIGVTSCWFNSNKARAIYFYGPMSVTVICNICLFISTALKIVRHKKDTAQHLRSSESRRHDDNKQWFNLYLKLFIVMGINWSMEIISWLFKSEPPYIWYLTDLTNTLQGLIIFIIFVWKEKIKRLLLKRFGCQDRSLFSRNSTRSGCHSTASRTCTTSGVISLQEKVNPYVTNCRAKSSSDEAD